MARKGVRARSCGFCHVCRPDIEIVIVPSHNLITYVACIALTLAEKKTILNFRKWDSCETDKLPGINYRTNEKPIKCLVLFSFLRPVLTT